jgi:hypothetical protein
VARESDLNRTSRTARCVVDILVTNASPEDIQHGEKDVACVP